MTRPLWLCCGQCRRAYCRDINTSLLPALCPPTRAAKFSWEGLRCSVHPIKASRTAIGRDSTLNQVQELVALT